MIDLINFNELGIARRYWRTMKGGNRKNLKIARKGKEAELVKANKELRTIQKVAADNKAVADSNRRRARANYHIRKRNKKLEPNQVPKPRHKMQKVSDVNKALGSKENIDKATANRQRISDEVVGLKKGIRKETAKQVAAIGAPVAVAGGVGAVAAGPQLKKMDERARNEQEKLFTPEGRAEERSRNQAAFRQTVDKLEKKRTKERRFFSADELLDELNATLDTVDFGSAPKALAAARSHKYGAMPHHVRSRGAATAALSKKKRADMTWQEKYDRDMIAKAAWDVRKNPSRAKGKGNYEPNTAGRRGKKKDAIQSEWRTRDLDTNLDTVDLDWKKTAGYAAGTLGLGIIGGDIANRIQDKRLEEKKKLAQKQQQFSIEFAEDDVWDSVKSARVNGQEVKSDADVRRAVIKERNHRVRKEHAERRKGKRPLRYRDKDELYRKVLGDRYPETKKTVREKIAQTKAKTKQRIKRAVRGVKLDANLDTVDFMRGIHVSAKSTGKARGPQEQGYMDWLQAYNDRVRRRVGRDRRRHSTSHRTPMTQTAKRANLRQDATGRANSKAADSRAIRRS